MNPLTLVKRIQSINSKEADLGISEEASWHAKYRDSAYVFVGGIPYDLTEGDLVAVFAQYGEVVDVNLIRDKGTGKSKGFAFLAYEDQRSTTLAVDNLNGAQILGRIIRVDHCSKYVKREEEDEETQLQKREARGVCRAFQRGECTRGASCKFSHDEQRAANTGWGHEEDKGSRWDHDKFEGVKKDEKRYSNQEDFRSGDKERNFRAKGDRSALEGHPKESGWREERRINRRDEDDETVLKPRGNRDERQEKRFARHDDHERDIRLRDDHNKMDEKWLTRHDSHEREPRSRDDHNRREEKRLTRYDSHEHEPRSRADIDRREEKRSSHPDDEFENNKSRYDRREEKRSSRPDDEFENNKSRDDRREEKRLKRNEDDGDYRREEKKTRRHGNDESEPRSTRDRDSREEKGSRRRPEASLKGDQNNVRRGER